MDIGDMRREFESDGLDRSGLADSPLTQFDTWFRQAQAADILEPNALSLATADDSGQPGVRTVLLKAYNEQGFVFFTNYESAKAQALAANPRAAMLFPWIALNRQVVIEGRVERISDEQSREYFSARPRGSRVGAWASRQSQVIDSREALEEEVARESERFGDGEIPRPPFWGGYRLIPTRIEFWQGRTSRLHDRFEYRRENEGWTIQRLQP